MYWASHDFFWIWLYIIFLALVFVVYKKRTLIILPIVALMVLCSDQSANLCKNVLFKRARPCHNTEINNEVRVNPLLSGCGGQYGFVSSHASNTFALAFFLSMLLMKRPRVSNGYVRAGSRFLPLFLFSWAALVSYSRIYNGLHYPLDVTGGAMLGIFIGFLAYRLWLLAALRFSRNSVS